MTSKRIQMLAYMLQHNGTATRKELRKAIGINSNSMNAAIAADLITYNFDNEEKLFITGLGRVVFATKERVS